MELWKKIGEERGKNLMDALKNDNVKLAPYQDVVVALTKELRRILKFYEEAEESN